MTTTIHTAPATAFTVSDANPADTITVSNGPKESGFQTAQIVTATDTFIFANKSDVTIDGGGDNDAVLLDNPNRAAGLLSLTIQDLGPSGTIDGSNPTATGPDITVGTLTMTAGGDIGVSRALRTQASTIVAVAGAGGIGNIDISNGVTASVTLDTGLTAFGTITLTNNGTIDDSNGVLASGSVSLTANGKTADINTGPDGISSAGSVFLQAGEDINLGDAIGNGSVDANAGILMTAGRNVTLNANAAIENLTSGDISITAVGNITMLTLPGNTGGDPAISNSASEGTVSLSTGSGGTLTVASTAGTAIASDNGTIDLFADAMIIDAGVDSGTARTVLAPVTGGQAIDLGGANGPGVLGLYLSDLDQITAGVVQVGIPVAGGITISAAIGPLTGSNVLTLVSNGNVTENSLGSLADIPDLRITAAGRVALTSPNNNINVVAADTSGSVTIVNGTNTLTIGDVDADAGIITSNAAINLTADGLSIDQQIDAGTGIVTFAPFTSSVSVSLGNPDSTGVLGLTDAELSIVTAGVVRVNSPSNITVDQSIIRQAGFNTLSLTADGTVQGPAPLEVANLAISSADGIDLINTSDSVDTFAFSTGGNAIFVDGSSNGLTIGAVDGITSSSSAGSTTIEAAGNLTLAAGISSSLATALTTSAGEIVDGTNGTITDLTAEDLSLSATTGIGAASDPLQTQVAIVGATTTTGGIFIDNNSAVPGTLNIGFDAVGLEVTGATGNISLINNGTIDSFVVGNIIDGPGNITVKALGADADINFGSQTAQFTISGSGSGLVDVEAGRDLNLGNSAGFGAIDSVAGSIKLVAGRNFTIDPNAYVETFGTGTITVKAGSNLTMTTSPGALGDEFATEGGAIALSAGAGATMTLASSGATAVSSSDGNITLTADFLSINAVVTADTGNILIKPVTAGQFISLGTATGGLTLSSGALNELTATTLTIGSSAAGSVQMAGTVNPTGVTNLTIKTGGGFSETAGSVLDIGAGALTIDFDGNGSGATADFSDLTITAGSVTIAGGAGADIFEFSAAGLAASDKISGGTGGDELLMTTAGTVHVAGVSGIETYQLANGANVLTLTNANFTGVTGNKITVDGGSGADKVNAAGLTGSHQAVLNGGAGNDVLTAGQHETMTGGAGSDTFILTTPGTLAAPDTNVITDFTHSSDKIAFSDAGFSLGLAGASSTPQALPSTLFVSNATGAFTSAAERFAYNTTTGVLSYDSQGNTGGSTVQLVATLTGHPTLTASDLFFVS